MNRESASQFRSKTAAENVRTWQRCRTGAMEPGGLNVELKSWLRPGRLRQKEAKGQYLSTLPCRS